MAFLPWHLFVGLSTNLYFFFFHTQKKDTYIQKIIILRNPDTIKKNNKKKENQYQYQTQNTTTISNKPGNSKPNYCKSYDASIGSLAAPPPLFPLPSALFPLPTTTTTTPDGSFVVLIAPRIKNIVFSSYQGVQTVGENDIELPWLVPTMSAYCSRRRPRHANEFEDLKSTARFVPHLKKTS